ncbi:MAG: hypothetical protein K8R68_05645 [Bacteroidales bacterium]|nr:hypothetical protein [Bacteroidales bacterium]
MAKLLGKGEVRYLVEPQSQVNRWTCWHTGSLMLLDGIRTHYLQEGNSKVLDDHPLENSSIVHNINKSQLALPPINIAGVHGYHGMESRYILPHPDDILDLLYNYGPLLHMTKYHARVITGISIIDDITAIVEYNDPGDGKKHTMHLHNFFEMYPGLEVNGRHLLSFISPTHLNGPINTGEIDTPNYIGHTVRSGDRIYYLADDYGFSDRGQFTKEVERLNPGIDFNNLKPGEEVIVPTQIDNPELSTTYALRRDSQASTLPDFTNPLNLLDDSGNFIDISIPPNIKNSFLSVLGLSLISSSSTLRDMSEGLTKLKEDDSGGDQANEDGSTYFEDAQSHPGTDPGDPGYIPGPRDPGYIAGPGDPGYIPGPGDPGYIPGPIDPVPIDPGPIDPGPQDPGSLGLPG